MKVLVTGGAGYIGSVVVEQLIQRGHQAIVYDNLSTGHRGAVAPGAVFIQGDVQDAEGILRALDEQRIEAVIHMAADSLVGESVADPLKYFNHNVGGAISLLGAMLKVGVKKIVFSSTAAVYGAPNAIPITEDTPTHPTNPYGDTKLTVEKMLRWCDQAHGLRYVSLRYFNAAGASERCGEDHRPETHLIPNVLRVAAGKAPRVNVFGEDYPTPDGTCVRDYVHVIDLADAHILALNVLERRSEIYNLGYGSGYSVAEVVEMARQVTRHRISTEGAARRAGDPPVLIASPDKIMGDLGWNPRHSELDRIIESAWRWRQTHPNGYEKDV